jgi:hypothetical protein
MNLFYTIENESASFKTGKSDLNLISSEYEN